MWAHPSFSVLHSEKHRFSACSIEKLVVLFSVQNIEKLGRDGPGYEANNYRWPHCIATLLKVY